MNSNEHKDNEYKYLIDKKIEEISTKKNSQMDYYYLKFIDEIILEYEMKKDEDKKIIDKIISKHIDKHNDIKHIDKHNDISETEDVEDNNVVSNNNIIEDAKVENNKVENNKEVEDIKENGKEDGDVNENVKEVEHIKENGKEDEKQIEAFICETCSKYGDESSFRKQISLQNHINSQHRGKNGRKWMGKHCNLKK